MSAEELLTAINLAFDSRPFPGAEARPTASAPAALPPASFGTVAWQQVPNEVLREGSQSLLLLSDAGFAYYLPAFMRGVVQDLTTGQPDSESLVKLLKLPIELSSEATALLLGQFEAGGPPATTGFEALLQTCLAQANEAIHRFIARAAQLTLPQRRVVGSFLSYMKAETGSREAELAIERYWFQFA